MISRGQSIDRVTLEIIECPQRTPQVSPPQHPGPRSAVLGSKTQSLITSWYSQSTVIQREAALSWSGVVPGDCLVCGQITALFSPWFSHKQNKGKIPYLTCPMRLKESNQTVAMKILCRLSIPMTILTIIINK